MQRRLQRWIIYAILQRWLRGLKFLQNALTSDNDLGFPAIPAEFHENSDAFFLFLSPFFGVPEIKEE